MSKPELVIIDETTANLSGLSGDVQEELIERMKIFDAKKLNTAAYKSGNDDAKEKMFDDDGFFPFFQIEDVLSILAENNVHEGDLEVVDYREPLKHPIEPENQPAITEDFFSEYGITLWEHQISAFIALLRNDKGIFDASTSSGKTLLAAGAAKLYDDYYPSLFITLNTKLAKDALKMYEKFELDVALITSGDKVEKRKEKIREHRHIIITEKLAMNLSEEIEGFNGVLVKDETHVLGESFQHFAKTCLGDCPIRVGMTGSLPDSNKNKLKLQQIKNFIAGDVIKEVLPGYLMDKGYAAVLDIRMVEIQDDDGHRLMQELGSEYTWDDEARYCANNDDRIEEIAHFILNNCPRNTMVICRPEFGVNLANKLECDFVDGTMKTEDREEIYKKFDEQDDYLLVASIGTSGVGLSIDMIHYGVVVDIGSSPSVFAQAVGRFMRKDNEGDRKNSAVVWDIYSNIKYGAKQAKERMAYYRKRGYPFQKKYAKLKVG